MTCNTARDDGLLRAYLDRELPARQGDELARHIAGCADCQSRVHELNEAAAVVRAGMAGSAPRPSEMVSAASALHRFNGETETARTLGGRLAAAFSRVANSMTPRRMAATAAPVLLAAGLVFTPLGSAAADFINVFRVQNVQPITLSTSTFDLIPEPEKLGTLVVSGEPKMHVTTLSDAAKNAGIPARAPAQLPQGFTSSGQVILADGGSAAFTYDSAKLNAYWQERGLKGQPPAGLAGLTVKADVPPQVVQFYGDQAAMDSFKAAEATRQQGVTPVAKPSVTPNGKGLVVAQLRSPVVQVPSDVDINKLRQEVLSADVVPPELAAQLLAIQDWQTTLPVPVIEGKSHQVQVDGTTGVLFGEKDGQAVIWQKNGVLTVVAGNVSEADLMAAANSLQ